MTKKTSILKKIKKPKTQLKKLNKKMDKFKISLCGWSKALNYKYFPMI